MLRNHKIYGLYEKRYSEAIVTEVISFKHYQYWIIWKPITIWTLIPFQNETGEPKKASNITKNNSVEAEDALKKKKKNEEGSLVVKAGFEEVHMFAKHKIYDAAKAGQPKGLVGGASWYEQYMMNVNKRKQELDSGLVWILEFNSNMV